MGAPPSRPPSLPTTAHFKTLFVSLLLPLAITLPLLPTSTSSPSPLPSLSTPSLSSRASLSPSSTAIPSLLQPVLRLNGGQGGLESGINSVVPIKPWYQTVDSQWESRDGAGAIAHDPYLEGYKGGLQHRYSKYRDMKRRIIDVEGSLLKFARGYESFGVHESTDVRKPGIIAKEWAPGAQAISLIGDFNGWKRDQYEYQKDDFGIWSLYIPSNSPGVPIIPHGSRIMLAVTTATGEETTRIPAWIKSARQPPMDSPTYPAFEGVFWNPPKGGDGDYQFKHPLPEVPHSLRIYEAHVGMSSEGEPNVNTYEKFADEVLPRIKDLGYNAIQLMAVQEHAYYASFGYHVTNFFAVASRSGNPDGLKKLIDSAHSMGIVVLIDCVHAHAAKNVLDGINMFDGTGHQYFHEGPEGYHADWDSRIFNYGSWEVLRFLLSNLAWWLEEYKFDGFRFDGVTSMLYKHRGVGHAFVAGYDEYFGLHTDMDAAVYMMLANDLIHAIRPGCVSIAEDVSGMPTLCRPLSEGGYGFDYRLAMGIPDFLIKVLKSSDHDWSMEEMCGTLINRRNMEKVIAYCESHDQALVGDKTIAFRLMDAEMYMGMTALQPANPTIKRGIALHKVLRMFVMALGGHGYLNFMGNEFGHPEWIDFPREGNDWSYHHARRQWSLPDQDHLRYKHLNNFDRAMHRLEEEHPWLRENVHEYIVSKHEADKVVVAEKGNLVFVFNFHPHSSFDRYRIGVAFGGTYKIALDSEWGEFGGEEWYEKGRLFQTEEMGWSGRPHSMEVYSNSRSVLVLLRTGAPRIGSARARLEAKRAFDMEGGHDYVNY